MSVQDIYLNQLRKERVKVVVQTINNENIEGFIKGFDNFCILLQTEKSMLLIYKHALQCILPPKDFILKPAFTEKEPAKRS